MSPNLPEVLEKAKKNNFLALIQPLGHSDSASSPLYSKQFGLQGKFSGELKEVQHVGLKNSRATIADSNIFQGHVHFRFQKM
jgi:hypothetical protein